MLQMPRIPRDYAQRIEEVDEIGEHRRLSAMALASKVLAPIVTELLRANTVCQAFQLTRMQDLEKTKTGEQSPQQTFSHLSLSHKLDGRVVADIAQMLVGLVVDKVGDVMGMVHWASTQTCLEKANQAMMSGCNAR
jgi:hypothetical protein